MGRGRAKAKQTKVARDLKYRTHETDLAALAAELRGGPGDPGGRVVTDDSPDDSPDDDPVALDGTPDAVDERY